MIDAKQRQALEALIDIGKEKNLDFGDHPTGVTLTATVRALITETDTILKSGQGQISARTYGNFKTAARAFLQPDAVSSRQTIHLIQQRLQILVECGLVKDLAPPGQERTKG